MGERHLGGSGRGALLREAGARDQARPQLARGAQGGDIEAVIYDAM